MNYYDSSMLNYRMIDLTQPLSPDSPTWGGSCGFCLEIKKDYDKIFRVQQIKMHAGVGTHMDAPSHRFADGISIEAIQIENCIVQASVIDVSHKAHQDYEISLTDIEEYEQAYGPIVKTSLVIGFTGWSRFWTEPTRYRNQDDSGQMHFPAFSKQAAKYLLDKDVAGIAIDTLSPDCLNLDYPVHALFLGADKYIIENVGDCSKLPVAGSYVIALPLRACGCTECPIRMVGLY